MGEMGTVDERRAYRGLGLVTPSLLRVTMGCKDRKGGGGDVGCVSGRDGEVDRLESVGGAEGGELGGVGAVW